MTERKHRIRSHTPTFRQAARAWRDVRAVVELDHISPLDSRVHDAAIATLARRFGPEIAAAIEVDEDDLLAGVTKLSNDQIDKVVRSAVDEARKRVRAGNDQEGYLTDAIEKIAQMPSINPPADDPNEPTE